MDNRQVDLCKYRIQEAKDTLKVADNCLRDDFYVASKEKAVEQVETARLILREVEEYLKKQNIL